MACNVEKEQNIKKRIRIIQRMLSVILACCLGYLALYRWDSYRQAKENERLQEIAGVFAASSADSSAFLQDFAAGTAASSAQDGETDETTPPDAGRQADLKPDTGFADQADTDTSAESSPDAGKEQNSASSSILPGYETLLQINPQIKGWIVIPDTPVSFPLLQGEDNEYYLKHDIYGQENRYGSIFVDCNADLYGGESNLIIYGHHMRDGSMFGTLKAYKEEAYRREHPSFFLFLPEEVREYQIIAVLHNDIFSREQDPFQYYDYARIENEEMFSEYCRGIKEHALYDTGEDASYGDELVTLCTCDYGGKEQRLLVVGRRL